MCAKLPKILVTGGAGFIGSAFVRLLIRECSLNYPCMSFVSRRINPEKLISGDLGLSPIVIDKLTYAGDLARLKEVKGKYKFYKADIRDKAKIESIFGKERPTIIVHFAAATHVDRSIQDASPFIKTNIEGTQILLDIARRYKIKRFIHISSDETYGEIAKGKFSEDSPLKPNSPYAASKAAADLLIKSYIRTYNFPAIIIRPCNNYGPWQYPEKFIPRAILSIIKGKKIPVYGKGKNIREWLYVDDCARGILKILEKGRCGETYNLGSNEEKKNIEVVKMILKFLKKDKNNFEFVKDRPGHDIRYSLNSGKVFQQTGWQPKLDFAQGLRRYIEWCFLHKHWLLGKYKNIALLYK